MTKAVIINGVTIETTNFYEQMVEGPTGVNRLKIGFDFKVKSSEYHTITTMLYTNDFIVNVPERGIEFNAEISSYSTSITNLYQEDAVGVFKLELIEK
ncbi:DUF3219 family protein [Bacillus sp. Marseille-P3661]|uniref:DUF3219 family protein n=1 Tax=Bacillus sp. Marseille-P3661 TaxID=1936234 RepID=UPI000C85ABD5|nr:DUF3219 family protein [Bacillus sp. Marseille-P3661]